MSKILLAAALFAQLILATLSHADGLPAKSAKISIDDGYITALNKDFKVQEQAQKENSDRLDEMIRKLKDEREKEVEKSKNKVK